MRGHKASDVWRRLRREEDGQDLLEYSLLVALIVLIAMGAVSGLGMTIKTVFWDAIAVSTGNI